jgi:hypothetical protein
VLVLRPPVNCERECNPILPIPGDVRASGGQSPARAAVLDLRDQPLTLGKNESIESVIRPDQRL